MAKLASVMDVSLPSPVDPSRPASTLLVLQNKGSHSLSTGDRYSSGAGQVPHDTSSSRTKEHALSLKQKKMFPHKVINPSQAVRTLCLLVRKCFRPKAHSCVAEWGQKTTCSRMFPTSRNIL